ncbi:MAG: hypothetical protein EOP00_00335 [Pedobacter sp.]|nr:MAG: hypothetical protein EOP00_00335 [Pedobacter sp.]
MKTFSKSPKSVAIAIAVLFLMLFACKKGKEASPSPKANEMVSISLIGLKSDGGYAYKIGFNLPVTGDVENNPTCSKLILFENGVELPTPHSNHQSIRDFGQGQYSHWGTELYFSASDNTNPLLNGRKYSYIIK